MLSPEDRDRLDALRANYPGCVHMDTEEGLVVVRRPTADEFIKIEDSVVTLVDLGAKLNPYAGLDAIKAVVVYPSADRVEALLNDYARFFGQLVNMSRQVVRGSALGASAVKVDLRDEELYMRESPTEEGRSTKRAGGRIFAVESFRIEPDEDGRPRRVVTGRHLMRRLGLIEDRKLTKEITATGYTDAEGNRQPRNATLAEIARSHVVEAPGCTVPDWEARPDLLTLLGQAVIAQSSIGAGSVSGK